MYCPKCNSKNIQRQSIVYESGTSQGRSISYNRRVVETNTNTMTELALKCSPPSEPKFDFLVNVGSAAFVALVLKIILAVFFQIQVSFFLLTLIFSLSILAKRAFDFPREQK